MSSPAVQVRSRVPRLAEAAVERARLSVVPRRRVRAAKVPFVTLVTLLLLGGVVGLLLFNTSMQQASFAATTLEQQAGNLTARQQTLQMELERLRDPQRVADRAQRLGMVLPAAPTYLNLADGSVTGTPMPATRENAFRIYPLPPVLPASINPAPQITWVQAPPEGVLADSPDDTGPGSDVAQAGGGRNESHQNQQPRQNQQNHQNQQGQQNQQHHR